MTPEITIVPDKFSQHQTINNNLRFYLTFLKCTSVENSVIIGVREVGIGRGKRERERSIRTADEGVLFDFLFAALDASWRLHGTKRHCRASEKSIWMRANRWRYARERGKRPRCSLRPKVADDSNPPARRLHCVSRYQLSRLLARLDFLRLLNFVTVKGILIGTDSQNSLHYYSNFSENNSTMEIFTVSRNVAVQSAMNYTNVDDKCLAHR